MTEKVYWGEGGEYGPYSVQADGWPNAGEIVLDYHKRSTLTAEEIAKAYSEKIKTHVGADWIYKMEQRNKVPKDIDRRRALAEILSIPFGLLGIATLESISSPKKTYAIPYVMKYSAVDLEQRAKEAKWLWKLHYANSAQDSLHDILTYIEDLELLEKQAKGDLLRHLCEPLNSFYRLSATIERDQGKFQEAYNHANHGVRVAKELAQTSGHTLYSLQILSASFFTRGVVNLAWGTFGRPTPQGQFEVDQNKVEAAFRDFERAQPHARPQLKGILWAEMARAKSLSRTSPADITIALSILEKAEQFVGAEGDDDFYTQILLDGDLKGLDERRLIIGQAKVFLSLDMPTKARESLDDLEELGGSVHTRRRGWTDILYGQASFGMRDFFTATQKGIDAFNECQEVHSVAHIIRIKELHGKLLASPYHKDDNVKHLGHLLHDYFKKNGN